MKLRVGYLPGCMYVGTAVAAGDVQEHVNVGIFPISKRVQSQLCSNAADPSAMNDAVGTNALLEQNCELDAS